MQRDFSSFIIRSLHFSVCLTLSLSLLSHHAWVIVLDIPSLPGAWFSNNDGENIFRENLISYNLISFETWISEWVLMLPIIVDEIRIWALSLPGNVAEGIMERERRREWLSRWGKILIKFYFMLQRILPWLETFTCVGIKNYSNCCRKRD